jgi:hypothetical protein
MKDRSALASPQLGIAEALTDLQFHRKRVGGRVL